MGKIFTDLKLIQLKYISRNWEVFDFGVEKLLTLIRNSRTLKSINLRAWAIRSFKEGSCRI